MAGRPGILCLLPVFAVSVIVGCRTSNAEPQFPVPNAGAAPGGPQLSVKAVPAAVDVRPQFAAGTRSPKGSKAALAGGDSTATGVASKTSRKPSPDAEAGSLVATLDATGPRFPELKALPSNPIDRGDSNKPALVTLRAGGLPPPPLPPPALMDEERESPALPLAPPRPPAVESQASGSTGEAPTRPAEPPPPIPSVTATSNPREVAPVPDTPPAALPPLPGSTPTAVLSPPTALAGDLPAAGPIVVGGRPVTFEALSQLVDGNGAMGSGGGCSSCGGDCGPGRPCPAGSKQAGPFPASHNPLVRFVGLVYDNVCRPDPCYQPHWEPIADSAFFVDAPRPTNNTRFRWDYGDHFAYPDRGEYFFARADGNGRGPKATDARLRAVPYIDYHELSLVSEIATGKASVAISVPYRTVNTTPFGRDALGFADMTITAKTLLVDSDLFLCASQFRTYVPIGNTGRGLGTGHVSLEPGLIFGLRCGPDTYVQSQVVEWIPIAGNTDYAGAHLRWGMSLNHIVWRPVRDVQLVGTMEVTGISFQDGLFTDPLLGPQKLSGRNAVAAGTGMRLFFCDTFDVGVGGNFGVTGKYLVREQMRFEMRFRY